MALIDKETISADIERRITDNTFGAKMELIDLLAFLDTLPDEQPVEGLDKARFLEVLDQWEAHAIRGMRDGATAYHQGKIALITDLRDWINREG